MNFYVYVHKKATTGEVFYVGKGQDRRAWEAGGRNRYWKSIVKKHGYVVEIFQNNLQEWYALELEQELILKYGRRVNGSGTLCNITSGGESQSGDSNARFDHTIWTFHNPIEKLTVKSNRYNFSESHPEVFLNQLFSEKNNVQHSRGWVVLEKVTDEYIEALINGFKERFSPRADKTVYTFVNIDSGITFIGTKWEMSDNYPEVNVDTLVRGTKRTSKRWALQDVYSSINLEKLRKPFSGVHSPAADKADYSFTNLVTGEIFLGSRCALEASSGKNVSTLFKVPAKITAYDWCLTENLDAAKKLSRNDYNKYMFIHKDGREFFGTRGEFKKFTGLETWTLFGKRSNKILKGWSLAPHN